MLVDEFRQVLTTYTLKAGNAEYKANSVENVGFATPVEPCDGVELAVKLYNKNEQMFIDI